MYRRRIRVLVVMAATGMALTLAQPAPAAPVDTDASPTTAQQDSAAEQSSAAERERSWATHPQTVEAAGYARRGAAPPGAVEAAEKARAELREQDVTTAAELTMRDNLYYAAKWYYDYQTITYTWSDYWEPCNMYQADCECYNRLVYWDAGWGQLWYTLRGQATTGFYTGYPRYGDLVFFDYDGDGWEGPYDHTGIYTGGDWVLHSSATYGYVLWSRVSVISAETLGGHWYVNIVDA
jgi:hypothetical protein